MFLISDVQTLRKSPLGESYETHLYICFTSERWKTRAGKRGGAKKKILEGSARGRRKPSDEIKPFKLITFSIKRKCTF